MVRWPLQPLQPLQKTQLQPPFGPSVDSLCHPWFTTTNLSYRFPIFLKFRHRLVRYYWYIDITLHFPLLHHITLRYTHYITLRHVPWLRYITWHYINSHYITLHYITLHYVTYIHIYLHGSAYLTITSPGPACSQLHSRPSTRVERTAPKSLELGNPGGGNRNPKEGYALYSP